jgi:hypothetical protein
MAFVNLSLLFGTGLIGIPILLHLVMRQQPRQMMFPAIRFIQRREETNRQTLKLRHWLLLLLRCAAVAAAAWALARPSVSSALFGNWIIIVVLSGMLLLVGLLLVISWVTHRTRSLLVGLASIGLIALISLIFMVLTTVGDSHHPLVGDREAPVAAVFLIDSSPRMQYRFNNDTRLDDAKGTADWLVRQLPGDSKVAVLDSRAITPVFSIDLATARKTIERVAATGAPRRLSDLLETGLLLFEQTDISRKELYVFTDLSVAAWRSDDPQRLQRMLQEADDISLYLIDVGVVDAKNLSLTPPELSSQSLPENTELTVSTALQSTGIDGRFGVELYVEELDPSLPIIRDEQIVTPAARLRSRQEVDVTAGSATTLQFHVRGLDLGTQQAFIQIAASDNLAVDDTRYLTVVVKEPSPVLVVAPPDVNTSGLVEAISPYSHRMEQRARHSCVVVDPEELPSQQLGDFSVVAMLDPSPMTSATWQQLGNYVRQGGQIVFFLGHNAAPTASFNTTEAVEILPGRLRRVYRIAPPGLFVAPQSYDHPILQPFRTIASSVPWAQFPVFRHWSLGELSPNSQVVLRFSNQQPALIERPLEKGTVLVMTTPITELERPEGRSAWNELAGPDDWPRFILVNQIIQYLSDHNADRFNFRTGQTVTLANRADLTPNRYLLFTPGGDSQPIRARDEQITIKTTDTPGIYRLKGNLNGPVVRGFSVNLPAQASQLDRVEEEDLDRLLGEDRYQLARQRDQIQRVQGQQRAGREFFPFLAALLALVLIAEHLLANRFYPQAQPNSKS